MNLWSLLRIKDALFKRQALGLSGELGTFLAPSTSTSSSRISRSQRIVQAPLLRLK